jgi:hypothetical protein
MNILLPRNAVRRTLFPRRCKSGAFLPAVFTGIVAAERNFHSIAPVPSLTRMSVTGIKSKSQPAPAGFLPGGRAGGIIPLREGSGQPRSPDFGGRLAEITPTGKLQIIRNF